MEWYVILFLILIVLTAGLCMFGVCTVFWMNIYLWDFRIQTEIWEQQSREREEQKRKEQEEQEERQEQQDFVNMRFEI